MSLSPNVTSTYIYTLYSIYTYVCTASPSTIYCNVVQYVVNYAACVFRQCTNICHSLQMSILLAMDKFTKTTAT